METVQGYVILKAAAFETGHGFALGHNPGAPSPFVTWQFTEGENGHRDYYWGRYGNSQAWAQKDFDRRVDDYQQLYHAAARHTEPGLEGVYRYYSTQRPVDIGTYPKLPDNQPLSIHIDEHFPQPALYPPDSPSGPCPGYRCCRAWPSKSPPRWIFPPRWGPGSHSVRGPAPAAPPPAPRRRLSCV